MVNIVGTSSSDSCKKGHTKARLMLTAIYYQRPYQTSPTNEWTTLFVTAPKEQHAKSKCFVIWQDSIAVTFSFIHTDLLPLWTLSLYNDITRLLPLLPKDKCHNYCSSYRALSLCHKRKQLLFWGHSLKLTALSFFWGGLSRRSQTLTSSCQTKTWNVLVKLVG